MGFVMTMPTVKRQKTNTCRPAVEIAHKVVESWHHQKYTWNCGLETSRTGCTHTHTHTHTLLSTDLCPKGPGISAACA